MAIARLARGGGEIRITQHVAGTRIVPVFDGVRETMIGQASKDGFAHFRGGPDVVIAPGDEHDRTANLLDGNCGARNSITIAQPREKQVAKHYWPSRHSHWQGRTPHETAERKRHEGHRLAAPSPGGDNFACYFVATTGGPRDAAGCIGDDGANLRKLCAKQ